MPRQPDPGKVYLLSNPTFAKIMKLLNKHANTNRPELDSDSNLIAAVNDSGSEIARGQCVEITADFNEESDDSFYESLIFSVDLPANQFVTRIGITLEPIADQSVGEVIISGVALCEVDITDTTHEYAKPDAASGTMVSWTTGPVKLLSTPAGTGIQFLRVQLAPEKVVSTGVIRVVADESFGSSDATFEGTVTRSDIDGIEVDDPVTVENYIAQAADAGAKCVVWVYDDETFELLNMECPA